MICASIISTKHARKEVYCGSLYLGNLAALLGIIYLFYKNSLGMDENMGDSRPVLPTDDWMKLRGEKKKKKKKD